MPVVLQFATRPPYFDLQAGVVVPAAGYFLDTFVSGTTTPQATYSDAAGTIANSNPIVLDSTGSATIYLTTALTYTFRLRRTVALGGGTVFTQNNLSGIPGTSAGSFLPLAGGTLTGPLVLAANASSSLQAVPKQQLDSGLAAVQAAVIAAVGTPLPTGATTLWWLSTPPSGWIELNGVARSRTTFAALFALWGTTFGVGDGTTTFGIPDTRGEFLRGWDNGRGVDSGRTLASAQLDAMQPITGFFGVDDRNYTNSAGATGSIRQASTASAVAGGLTNADTSATGTDPFTGFLGLDSARQTRTAAETRPRNVAAMWIVKT